MKIFKAYARIEVEYSLFAIGHDEAQAAAEDMLPDLVKASYNLGEIEVEEVS